MFILVTGLLDTFNAVSFGGFSASLNAARVPFDYTMTSNWSCFQTNGTYQPAFLVVPTSAVYWMHISVDVPVRTQAHLFLVGTTYQFAIVRNHTSLPGSDTMIRDGVVSLAAGQSVTLVTDYPVQFTGLRQPYWAGFRLDNYFSPLIAISVACTTPVISWAGHQEPIVYDRVLVNIGSAWNTMTNQFTAPVTGIYLFSFSAGVMRRANWNPVLVELLVNGLTIKVMGGGVNRHMTQDNTIDFISRTFLLVLSQYDNVTSVVAESTAYSDPINWQNALHAVLYCPQNTAQVRRLFTTV